MPRRSRETAFAAASALVLLACGGCGRRDAPPPQPPAEPAASAQTPGAGIDGAADAGLAGDDERERRARQRNEAALGRGRSLAAANDLEGAIQAFTEALEARPMDPAALGERGHARVLAGREREAEEDLVDAVGLAEDPKLRAQAYFSLGLLREKQKKPEEARVAFAASAHLAPAEAALAKLAGQSKCPASIRVEKAAIARSWREAYQRIGFQDPLERNTEQEAKRSVCRVSTARTGEDALGAACDGDPPWEVSGDYGMYRANTAYLAPLSGGRLLVAALGMIGGGWCAGNQSNGQSGARAELKDGVLIVTATYRFQYWVVLRPADADAGVEELGQCRASHDRRNVVFHDPRSGRAVTVSTDFSEIEPSLAGRTVTVSGAGCAERVDLDAPAPAGR